MLTGPTINLQVFTSSCQCFAFSWDGALPFSGALYRINNYTGTPVNTVRFCIAFAALLGALTFTGAQAMNAVFSALYIPFVLLGPLSSLIRYQVTACHGHCVMHWTREIPGMSWPVLKST